MSRSFDKGLNRRRFGGVLLGPEDRRGSPYPYSGTGDYWLLAGIFFCMVFTLHLVTYEDFFMPTMLDIILLAIAAPFLVMGALGARLRKYNVQRGPIIFRDGIFNPDVMGWNDNILLSTERCWIPYSDIHCVYFSTETDRDSDEKFWVLDIQLSEKPSAHKDPCILSEDYPKINIQDLIEHFLQIEKEHGVKVIFVGKFREEMGLED